MFTRNLSGYNKGSGGFVLPTQYIQNTSVASEEESRCTAVKVLTQQKSVYWQRTKNEFQRALIIRQPVM